MTRDDAREKIIFALDVNELSDVEKWSDLLAAKVGMFKIGKQLFTSFRPGSGSNDSEAWR